MKLLRIAAAAVLLTAACAKSPSDVPSRSEIPAGTPVTLNELSGYSRHYSGIEEPSRIVVTSDSAWHAVAGRIYGPGSARPSIDFANEFVIVAAMGGRATGGYGISVDRAVRTASEVVVEVVESSVGRGCITTHATSAPVHAVRIARQDVPVRFTERKVVRNC